MLNGFFDRQCWPLLTSLPNFSVFNFFSDFILFCGNHFYPKIKNQCLKALWKQTAPCRRDSLFNGYFSGPHGRPLSTPITRDGNFFQWDEIETYFYFIKIFRDGIEIFFYLNYICGTRVRLTNSVLSRLITN